MDDLVGNLLKTLLVFALYFVPTIVAKNRKHRNYYALFMANLLLGWTVIGWIVCLIWAMLNQSGGHPQRGEETY